MTGNLYKNLEVWKLSVELIKDVYKLAESLPKSEDFNLKQQLKRAVVSVSLNIAEGKNRRTARDFAHFVNLSSASLAEVEAILAICQELGFMQISSKMETEIQRLAKMLNSLRSSLQAKDNK
jgi:four helix bundle protein